VRETAIIDSLQHVKVLCGDKLLKNINSYYDNKWLPGAVENTWFVFQLVTNYYS
jgi:hypothetical protein